MERQAETDNDGQCEGGSVSHALWRAPREDSQLRLMVAGQRWLERALRGHDPSAEWNEPDSSVQAQW